MRKFTVGRDLVANVETTLFTVPKGMHCDIKLIHMSNNGSNNIAGSVKWHDNSQSVDVPFLNGASFTKGETKSFDQLDFVLTENDQIKALAAGDNMSVIVTFEMYPAIASMNNFV